MITKQEREEIIARQTTEQANREAEEAARKLKRLEMMNQSLREQLEKEAPAAEKEDDIYELFKAMAVAAFIAIMIRSFLFEPFNIPSGSLLPTLQVGDYLFVEKYAYGYSKYSFPFDIINFKGRIMGSDPRRGDIAVFRQPKKPGIDYIKRIIGLPGDRIQVKGGMLNINGHPVTRDWKGAENVTEQGHTFLYQRYIETLPNGLQHFIYEIADDARYDNTPIYVVPEGYYFAMGDNRDSSLDSRAQEEVGFIPAENLIGRAWFIFFSTEGTEGRCPEAGEGRFSWVGTLACKLRLWPQVTRYNRIFKSVNKL